MGATSTPTKLGSGYGEVNAISANKILLVQANISMSASYATGGDTVTLDTDVKGAKLRGLLILTTESGLNRYAWVNGLTTPKILARVISTDAEVANATDLSAVVLTVVFIYEGS